MDPTSGENLRLDQTGINYKLLYVQGIGRESDTQAVARFINCVAFAFYYYAVTYIIIIIVLWTEGASEINY